MTRSAALILRASLLAIVLVLSSATAASAQKRIIGGSNVSITDHPYQVKVDIAGVGSCGGSIRDATHVITAAHCVVNEEFFFPFIVAPGAVSVGYGASNRTQLTRVGVQRVSVHPAYLRSLSSWEFDVAVLTLNASIDLSGPNAKAIAPATAAELNEGFEPANPADPPIPGFATGWGLTAEDGNTLPLELQGVTLPLRANEACIARYGHVSQGGVYNAELMLCAGGQGTAPAGNPDTCQGDSGGPLAMDVDRSPARSYKLIGLSSFGTGCGRQGTPGVYAWVGSPLLSPFLYAQTPAAPPPAPPVNPTISGTPQVGGTLTCNAPPLAGATVASYLWSVYDPAESSFSLLAAGSGPTLALSAASEGALLLCDARYEGAGGFSYTDTQGQNAVGPVQPAPLPPVVNPPIVNPPSVSPPPVNPPAADTTRPRARIGTIRCVRRRCTIKVRASDVGGRVRSLSARLTYNVRRCRTLSGRRRCRSVKKTKRLRPRSFRDGFTITTRLRRGRYVLTAIATDTSGNRSVPARKRFRVR